MKVWRKMPELGGDKFLVMRRDGTVPPWPWFVLGARDPAAPAGLRAYAEEARKLGMDPEYCDSVLELASDFEGVRAVNGSEDPDASPHRTDDPEVLRAMRGECATIVANPHLVEQGETR